MLERDKDWNDGGRGRRSQKTMEELHAALTGAGIPYEVKNVEAGFGIVIRKA
jgi:hypothetical protein